MEPMTQMDTGSWLNRVGALGRDFRPALPAALGAVALTFLFAAVMPMAWVRGLSWNLYLDRLSPVFLPPVEDSGRLALAIAMALVAGLLAVLVALALAKPGVQGNAAMNRRIAARARKQDGDSYPLPRRAADRHPDDSPRPPISAARDLPAEGLGPIFVKASVDPVETEAGDLPFVNREIMGDETAEEDDDYLELTLDAQTSDDNMMVENVDASPVFEDAGAFENPASLGAMVARFETGMARRRQIRDGGEHPTMTAKAANEDEEPEIDFALEAALSTLQRMNRTAIG